MLLLDERNPYSPTNPPPEKYDLVAPTGIAKAAGMAALKLPVDVASALTIAAGGIERLTFGSEHLFKGYDEVYKPIQDYLTPEPGSVSDAGRFISGIAGFAPALALGPAGIPILAGQAAINTGAGLVEQGVGPGAATAAGILSGATTVAMAGIPQAAKTWAGTLALASLNPVIGGVSTQAEKSLLQATGNEKVAEQYDPLDKASRGIDAVLGLAFGAMGKYAKARQGMKTQTQDSIDTVANWQRAFKDTPFDISDPKTADLGYKAMQKALADISAGKPVDLSEVLPDTVPLKKPDAPIRAEEAEAKAAISEAVKEATSAVEENAPWVRTEGVVESEPQSSSLSPQPAEPQPSSLSPEVLIDAPVAARMETRLAEGDFPIHTGKDFEGNPTSISARDFIAKEKAEYKALEAQKDIYDRISKCLS